MQQGGVVCSDAIMQEFAPISEVELCGRSDTSRCGYCKSSGAASGKSHVTFGMTSKRLHSSDYQALLDRGWRRSGMYLYKPINDETCCPCYTIRLEAQRFRPSRHQRHVTNKLQRFIDGTDASPSSSASTSPRSKDGKKEGKKQGVGSQADAIAESLCVSLRAATASVCTSLGVQGFDPSGVRVLKQGPLGGGKKGQQASTDKGQSPSAEEIGGYSSALALQLSAHVRKQGKALSPVDVAQLLVSTWTAPADVRVCVASNGFLNFHLPPTKAQEEEEGEGMLVDKDKEEGKRLRGSGGAQKAAEGPSARMAEGQRKGEAGQGQRKEVAKAWAEGRRKKTGEGHLRRGDGLTGALEGKGDEEGVEEGEEEGPRGGGAMQPEAPRPRSPGKRARPEGAAASAGKEGGTGTPKHSFTVETVPARVTEEVYKLYLKYQVLVHDDSPDEVTKPGFKRFLVSTPLAIDESTGARTWAGDPDRDYKVPYGSYHQLYRIDGRLVAVGVVDILPSCLSSVYCFYDPDYRGLSLGKVTALWEIQWVKRASAFRPNLRYYYLGFYIHSCPKMKYKGDYEPSDLLCPETYEWVPLASCRALLDATPYARLAQVLEQPSPDSKLSSPPPPPPPTKTPAPPVPLSASDAPPSLLDIEDDESEDEEEEEEEEEEEMEVSEGEEEYPPPPQPAPSPSTERQRRALASKVHTDLGQLSALPDRFQKMLVPILADFAEYVGPVLAERVFVTFR